MRTSALRLSVVYAAIFAGALLALVFVIYLLTARFIDAEADTAIERDAAGFLEAYARGGVRTLAAEVNLRAENWSRTNAVYLLTDAQGFVLAGNLPAWPTMRRVDGDWVDFEIVVQEAGFESERPVRAMVLEPSPGLRFMVGTDLSERHALGRRFLVAAGAGSLLVPRSWVATSRAACRWRATRTSSIPLR